MSNISIGLDKLTFNKIGEYTWTEFYPKNWVLAYGEFNWANKDGKVFTILISIMKINDTQFTAMGPISCSNISSAEECRNTFATDDELKDNYYEDLDPEYFCVTLVYKAGILNYKTLSFITGDISNLDEITTDTLFNLELRQEVEKLLNE